jgi:periplasmic divalent cation tolerance protein
MIVDPVGEAWKEQGARDRVTTAPALDAANTAPSPTPARRGRAKPVTRRQIPRCPTRKRWSASFFDPPFASAADSATTRGMHAAQEYSCVLVTAPNLTVARKLAAAALTERLVACANLIPKVESHYRWKGQLESSSEVLILFKTAATNLPELEACVLRNHPYDTPEFVALRLDQGNERYLEWLGQLSPTAK